MKLNTTFCFITICLIVNCTVFGQNSKDLKNLINSANAKFKMENYEEAIEDYRRLVVDDPKNETYNYNLAVCYLNSNLNKSKAIPYLEIIVRNTAHNPKADFLLGRAYQYANRFDDALNAFNKFKEIAKKEDDLLGATDIEIQHCINGKELIKYPIDVTFNNLGKAINSEYADYYPFVTEDEAYMVYNSKRPKNKDVSKTDNGQYLNSIYISKVINGEYTESDIIGAPICEGNTGEEVIGMNAKGNIILVYKANLKGEGKIYLSRLNEQGMFSKLEMLPSEINGTGDVISACINNDASTIYFASNRKGGFGGTDLYYSNKLPNGKWSEAANMGPAINTIHNEDFPNLSPNNKVFYFSSKGHTSMGGYDIFKTVLNEETNKFENPINIGYPINTSYDDFNFRISKNGRYGYVASLRGGGLGDYDIQRVTFKEIENDYTILIGNILPKDTTLKVDYRSTYLTVYDNITNDIVGNYIPNPENGRFIIIVPPGKYSISCEAPDFEEYKFPITVFDKASYQSEINLYIELKK